MAVEAHHLLHTGGHLKLAATDVGCWEGGAMCCDTVGRQSQLLQQGYPHQQSLCVEPMMMMGQYGGQVCAAADASESGVTFGSGAQEVEPCRKQKRGAEPSSQFLAAHLQQQLVDVDGLVLQHTAKMYAELREQSRRHARQVVAAVEAAAAKRLRAKDEEMERIGQLNWALEERVKGLFVEAQVWRDLAQSNEAEANALRGELQRALDGQARRAVAAAAGDAASCCCGENDVGSGAGEEVEEVGTTRRCTVCGEGAVEVLLLPCRHLCTCAACAAVARACPACGCAKNGTVRVNFP